jgi:HEAT repeat protein
VELFTAHGTPRHIDAMIRLIRRGSLLDRGKLLDGLLRLAKADDERVMKLLHRYLLYGDQHSRLLAVNAVARLRDCMFVEDLLYLLEKETAAPVRLAVVAAMGNFGDGRCIAGLEWAAANDPDPVVRTRSAEILNLADHNSSEVCST